MSVSNFLSLSPGSTPSSSINLGSSRYNISVSCCRCCLEGFWPPRRRGAGIFKVRKMYKREWQSTEERDPGMGQQVVSRDLVRAIVGARKNFEAAARSKNARFDRDQ